jgi:hypothetical protein
MACLGGAAYLLDFAGTFAVHLHRLVEWLVLKRIHTQNLNSRLNAIASGRLPARPDPNLNPSLTIRAQALNVTRPNEYPRDPKDLARSPDPVPGLFVGLIQIARKE